VPIEALRDRYRCSEGVFEFRLAGKQSRDAGYFRFGPDIVGYGRLSGGVHQAQVTSSLYDASLGAKVDGTHVTLPFDPTEVIDNLRLERYANGQWGLSECVLKKIYYWVRPLTNVSTRKHVKRFYASQRKKGSFPRWPVDTTVESICEKLLLLSLEAKRVDRVPFVWFWPKGARSCVLMTHDVETEAGRDFCSELMDIDDRFGVKAAFQIVPEDRYQVAPEFLSQFRERGFEIGVQDLNHDGGLFDDRDRFLQRVALINRYGREYGAKGFRSAVLYRKPEWYQDFEFSYDMSIPNVAHLDPQYGGCCTVMPYFIGDILELPVTTVQDYTLFHLLNGRGIDLWKEQVKAILAKNGLVSFIVHPDYIIESDAKSVYEALLSWLRELREQQDLWFALPGDVDGWWRARNQMSVVKDGESWRVMGEGAEQAVVAFARAENGQLVYELADSRQPQTRATQGLLAGRSL
jgi:hypothetical protein